MQIFQFLNAIYIYIFIYLFIEYPSRFHFAYSITFKRVLQLNKEHSLSSPFREIFLDFSGTEQVLTTLWTRNEFT